MEGIRIMVNGEYYEPQEIERECTSVTCWYDPHYRHWVLYPVDAEGNQLDEASYAFGKDNARATKQAMEAGLIGIKF